MSDEGDMNHQALWVLQRVGDTQKENDKKKVNGHVKALLFERVVFVWEMASLDHGGKLHLDYLKNCRALLANGNVVSMWDDEAVTYMNLLLEVMKKDQSYIICWHRNAPTHTRRCRIGS